MLKWTVSRSLSTASSTPHGPGGGKTTRRPFRDLSNTPPAGSSSSRASLSRPGNPNDPTTNNPSTSTRPNRRSTPGVKRTPAKRKRCRSQGSDLRGYFQATKPSSRSGKRLSQRNSSSPVVVESFYQSTPRVDTDIGPLIPSRARYPVSCSNSVTLPTDPQTMLPPRGCGGASGAIFPAQQQPNKFQSHVSDFFQQISMATSPEDIIEFESLPFAHNSRRYALRNEERRRHCTPCLPPKLARITRLHARIKTPHHSATGAERCVDGELEDARQTPLAGKLLSLKLDANPAEENDTALPGTVSEDWSLGRKREANTSGAKSVAEILLGDSAERRKVLGSGARSEPEEEEHIYETIDEGPAANVTLAMELDESKAAHNDSSVSSASQLLENPSPLSWQGSSDAKLATGEFPLRRQRGIRRKRQARDKDGTAKSEAVQGKRPRREDDEDATDPETNLRAAHHSLTDAPMSAELRDPVPEGNRRRREAIMSTSTWDTDSLKSSLLDSFATSMTTTSAICTPEAPLVATVRRCLKYSPETPCPSAEYSGSSSRCSNASNCLAGSGGNGSGGGSNSRGSIEIACFAQNDRIHIRVIRCRDLRRAYEGPINAYVKASIKDPRSGEGCVKRTAVHRATPNPVFNESLVLPCPPAYDNHCAARQVSLDIAVWHRDRRARRSELLGCMTLPLPLSQDKEATWHPLEAGSGRNTSSAPAIYGMQQQDTVGGGRGSVVSPPLSNRDGAESIVTDNNNGSASGPTDDLTYLRHLELEPLDPLTGLPLHPGFTARGGRTPCTVTRRLVRSAGNANQVPWGFSLSWGRPPRVERVDPGSPAERSGLRPGDYVVFVESSNVVTQPRDDILELIQAATSQLVLEVYRRGVHGHAVTSTASHRQSSANAVLQAPPALLPPTALGGAPVVTHPTIAFTAEQPFPSLSADASPEEELGVREARHWSCLKNGQTRFMVPLTEHRDVLAASDYLILFQNLDELLKLSEELLDEGSGVDSYLCRVPRITATYRRYLSGLQRACCLLVALRKNAAFAKIVCEPAVPRRRKPDLTGVLLQPLDHYREMTRLLCQACPRNCQPVRDLAQGYREATANAAMMEPPRDTGRPLLSLQEVESRLVFARCKPFTLAVPGRQWLFGGALAKVEGRGRLQPTWALLLSDLLVFARISRDRVLFVTEEPLRLACIAEACFTIRKRPTEFRLQVTTQPSMPGDGQMSGSTEIVQCGGTGGGVGVGGGCSPHGRPRRRVLILRAPSPELKAVWHNLLQRQIIYVNTGYGGASGPLGLDSPDDDSPTTVIDYHVANTTHSNNQQQREITGSPEIYRSTQQLAEEHQHQRSGDNSLEAERPTRDVVDAEGDEDGNHHLAQWVRNSHQIPPPDQEALIEEWTPEELAARTPKESNSSTRDLSEAAEESTMGNSDAEQQSSASSASISTVKSNSKPAIKNGVAIQPRDAPSPPLPSSVINSINMCRKCHRSGCPTPPARDPFSPLPPKISVMPPTPDLCFRHRGGLKNAGLHDSPGRSYSADGTNEDGSEDDLDCDGDPPYRALRRYGTLSSLDQDDDLEEQLGEEESGVESPPSGLRGWSLRATSYVVSKMSILEHFNEGCFLQAPVPPERTECSSLDPNSNGDEEGTTSGGTSGDDIWGTPTSGGPDDESFTGSPPPTSHYLHHHHHHHPYHHHHRRHRQNNDDDDEEEEEEEEGEDNEEEVDNGDEEEEGGDSEGEDDSTCSLPELSMEQLLTGGSGRNSFHQQGRRRLEPLPEEEDSVSLGSSPGRYQQVGWW